MSKMKRSPQERMDLMARLRFHCDVKALDLLSSTSAVARLQDELETLDSKDKRNFLSGYRLAVATPLHSLLWFAIEYPELLDLHGDHGLLDWMRFDNSARAGSLLSAVSEPGSDLGQVCYVIDSLEIGLRRADRDDAIDFISEFRTLAARLGELVTGAEIVALDADQTVADRDSLARLCLAERVLDYAEHDSGLMTLAYGHIWAWNDTKEPRTLDDDSVLAAETHLDHVPVYPYITRGIPCSWLHGLWFGFDLVVRLAGIALSSYPDTDPIAAQNWIEELTFFVSPSYPKGDWPSKRYGLTELRRLNVTGLVEEFGVNIEAASSNHRLAALLGKDNVRVITSAGAGDVPKLEVTLRGAIAMCGDSKVHVLLITHSVGSDSRQWVSVAVRLPIYGSITNASEWFLFYKLYHTGRAFDTDVAHAAKAVDDLLLQLKDNLRTEKIDGLRSEDFLPLCTLPAFHAMKELSQRAVAINANLRSVNSELLAAFWLTHQGYRQVKVSFKHASLGKYEYDAIGVKDGRCLVMEVKGANVLDDEFMGEIGKFANRLGHLQKRKPELAKALGEKSDIEDVLGHFIFLGDLCGIDTTGTAVIVWDRDKFVSALKETGFPSRIVDLLDRCHIIHSTLTVDWPDDPFCVGLEDA